MANLEVFDPIKMDFWVSVDPITCENQQRFFRHVLASLEKHIRFVLDKGATSNDDVALLRELFAEYRLVNKEYRMPDKDKY